MSHTTMNIFVSLVFLLALISPSLYSVFAAYSTQGCYHLNKVIISPRTRDLETNNYIVPLLVKATHKPDMNLCFQGVDTTYEVYPVSARAEYVLSNTTHYCRPLVPSRAVTSMDNKCFTDVDKSVADNISVSGVKQQGTYGVRNNTLNICSSGTPGKEQDCPDGLHIWMATCDTAECTGWQVASYYCPELIMYTVELLQHAQFQYMFQVKKTLILSDDPGVVSELSHTLTEGDQPHLYSGWTRIGQAISLTSTLYTARPLPVDIGDCTDYCAMEQTELLFHTQNQCYEKTGDLCGTTWQMTWKKFNFSHNKAAVPLPYIAVDGSMLDTQGTYTTPNIVSPFSYTAHIDLNAPQTDREITALCSTTSIDSLDVGVHTKKYPQPDILYVRRVCDQIVLSLYDCVLQYSHHDGMTMYWSVENRGTVSNCTIYVVDDSTVFDVVLSVTPMAERKREHEGGGVSPTKKLPAWVTAVIVIAAVVVVAAVAITVLCMCPHTRPALMAFFWRKKKNNAATACTIANPLEVGIFDDLEMNVYASQSDSGSADRRFHLQSETVPAGNVPGSMHPPTGTMPPHSPPVHGAFNREEPPHQNEPEPLNAVSGNAEAQPPPVLPPMQLLRLTPEPQDEPTEKERKERLFDVPEFGPRVSPSPPISPCNAHSPYTVQLLKGVEKWQHRNAEDYEREELHEASYPTTSLPSSLESSNDAEQQPGPAGDVQQQARRLFRMMEFRWNVNLTEFNIFYRFGGWWLNKEPNDSTEVTITSSRSHNEPDLNDDEEPPAGPANNNNNNNNENPPAWLLREDVGALLTLIVNTVFNTRDTDEQLLLSVEMVNNWARLESVQLDTLNRSIPLVFMTANTPQSVMPEEWELDFVRAAVRSADYHLFHERREVYNDYAIECAIADGTRRVMRYIKSHGGRLVPCLMQINLRNQALLNAINNQNQ